MRSHVTSRLCLTAALLALPCTFLCARNAQADAPSVVRPSPVANAPTAPGDASADSSADDPSTVHARNAFVTGVELAKLGRWNEARAAFEQSNELSPHAVTTYNVGFCDRALGHYARAELALALSLAEDLKRPSLPDELRKSAHDLLAELRNRTARAIVTVTAQDTRLLVDGRPLDRVSSGQAGTFYLAGSRDAGPAERLELGKVELRLDPGTHVFQLTEAGRTGPDVVETFQSGETRAMRFQIPVSRQPDGLRDGTRSQPRWPLLTAGSVGGLGLLTGTVFGVLSLTTHSDLSSECRGARCPPGHDAEIARLHTFEDLATGGFVVGAAALAIGAALWFSQEGPSKGSPAAATHGTTRALHVSIVPAGVRGDF